MKRTQTHVYVQCFSWIDLARVLLWRWGSAGGVDLNSPPSKTIESLRKLLVASQKPLEPPKVFGRLPESSGNSQGFCFSAGGGFKNTITSTSAPDRQEIVCFRPQGGRISSRQAPNPIPSGVSGGRRAYGSGPGTRGLGFFISWEKTISGTSIGNFLMCPKNRA